MSYDAVAERYAKEIGDELPGKPIERALYASLAELLRPLTDTGRPVADVGCGPGHVTGYLADLGLPAVGVDISEGMLAVARARRPDLEFRLGTFADLGVPDGAWAGGVAAYSIIHVAPADRPAACAELARAIVPGGWLLLSFHVSDPVQSPGSTAHLGQWWGHDVDLDFHFLDPAELVRELSAAGFTVLAQIDREPWPGTDERSRRCHLLAQRPPA